MKRKIWVTGIIFCLLVMGLLFSRQAGVQAQSAPAWQPYTTYATNALVTYQGVTYRCIQGHTSLPGWEPPNVPALWQPVSGSPTMTATAVPPTATTSPPTATPPGNTATPTAVPPTVTPGGGCTAPAWNPGTVYVNGNIVAHNGRQWGAKWWTLGEEPGTTGPWGVWQDLGVCNGATVTPTSSPAPTNTPQPTNTPGPTATPCTNCGGSLPARLLIGYWHNFDNGSSTPKLREVSQSWDVVNVAFAEPQSPGSTVMAFTPYNAGVAEFQNDVQILHGRSQKVLISVGGANVHLNMQTAAQASAFASSMISIIETYGFDGMDIDLEGGSLSLGAGDTDFRNPTTPRITHFISAVQSIINHFGPDFILTAAPETAYVQGGYSVYGGLYGAYLPLIYAFHDRWTVIHVQHYNSGCMLGLNGVCYTQGTADFQVAMAEMLLAGFPVAGTGLTFPALRQDQVAIGLPAAPAAAGGGYTPPATVHQALNYLILGIPYGGNYPLQNAAGYADFRGLMAWSINWDVANGYQFSTSHRIYLDGLD